MSYPIEITNADEVSQHRIVKALNSSPIPLMEAILNHIQDKDIIFHDFICDHLCWRCASLEEYVNIKSLFTNKNLGEVLIECMIGDRPISTIHLNQAILIKTNTDTSFSIPGFELPCPKPCVYYESGWEHCEFAVGNKFEKLEDFVNLYKSRIEFDYCWKESNADVSLKVKYSVGKEQKVGTVKFHLEPLEEVVKHELAEGTVEFPPKDYFDKVKISKYSTKNQTTMKV